MGFTQNNPMGFSGITWTLPKIAGYIKTESIVGGRGTDI